MFRPFLAAALLLAPLPAFAAPPPLPAQVYSDRLAKLDPVRRRAAIRAAINDSDMACPRVIADRLNGRYNNLIMWNARCTPAKDYALFLGPDGSVQIRPCADLAALKLPLCRRYH